ncbi:YraN family protein [Flammeovirga sp. EKP202]|uniref:YraN family protein n=1 Tax=Flammeovirga sp. EKP202 TaxID=2770592 RepID=UPI00165F3C98|nr:YraN family protein [Flammeovirga sp. EKP202]MBD0403921.1 YraN family protein [Flammeovirga sp. EKP202]
MTSTKTQKQQTGTKGEIIATDFLIKKGFQILKRNYRYKRNEIDIICQKDNFLVFVEVKTRKNKSFGNPEEHVSQKQIDCIQDASIQFQNSYQGTAQLVRYDIISIIIDRNVVLEILHLEDAF